MTMTLIATATLSANATTIQFSNIPQTYKDLVLMGSVRTAYGSYYQEIYLAFNGDFGNGVARSLWGSGSGVGCSSYTTASGFVVTSSTATASTFGNFNITFPDYTVTTTKDYFANSTTENNSGSAFQMIGSGNWNSTAAISSLFLYAGEQLFIPGSTVSLYGISTTGATGATIAY